MVWVLLKPAFAVSEQYDKIKLYSIIWDNLQQTVADRKTYYRQYII
jgi:hypothetical protein